MKVCVIGLGYVGLPTAILLATNGMKVVGVDINAAIVEETNNSSLHITEPGFDNLLKQAIASGSFRAVETPEEADTFLIVVPTPLMTDKTPDISNVEAATMSVLPHLKEGNLFIIESTCPVGTTEKIAGLIYARRPELKGKIHIAYCPERVLPGNIIHELINNDRIIGGIDKESTERVKDFYSRFVKGQLHDADTRMAEMCKLTENASRDVQIAFANELSLICDKAGIDVRALIRLANKHPRVNILQPGCGVGGHCIAVDPYFLTTDFANEARMIAQAREANNYKQMWCAEKIKNAMLQFKTDRHRYPTVAMMGLAYKPDIDDLRNSPAMKIVSDILRTTSNSKILVVEPNLRNHRLFKLEDYKDAYQAADIIVYLVGHKEFRSLPKCDSKIVIDFCGIN